MYFTGLQNVSHFKYYPKSNFRKKKAFVKLNLTLKNHTDKQLSNTTGLIRCLAYLPTRQISRPQSPASRPHVETEPARRCFPDAVEGEGKARNFFGKRVRPWPPVCDCCCSRGCRCCPRGSGTLPLAGVQRSSTATCLACAVAWWQPHPPPRV